MRAETENSEIAEAASGFAVDIGAVRLRGVIDDANVFCPRKLGNRTNLRRIAEQMRHNDGSSFARQRRVNCSNR